MLGLRAGRLDLAAETRDGGAQLLGVAAGAGGGLLRGGGDRGQLLEPLAQRADVRQHGAGTAVDLVEPLLQLLDGAGGAARGGGLLGDLADAPIGVRGKLVDATRALGGERLGAGGGRSGVVRAHGDLVDARSGLGGAVGDRARLAGGGDGALRGVGSGAHVGAGLVGRGGGALGLAAGGVGGLGGGARFRAQLVGGGVRALRLTADGVGGLRRGARLGAQLVDAAGDRVAGLGQLVDPARRRLAGGGDVGQAHPQRLLGVAQDVDLAAHLVDDVALDGLVGGHARLRVALLERAAQLGDLGGRALAGGAELVALAAGLVQPRADLLLLAAEVLEPVGRRGARAQLGQLGAQRLDVAGAFTERGQLGAQRGQLGGALAQRGELGAQRVELLGAGGGVEAGLERLEAAAGGLQRVDPAGQRGGVGGAGLQLVDARLQRRERGDLVAQRLDVRHAAAQRRDLLAQRGQVGGGGLQRGKLGAEGVDVLAAGPRRVELGAQRGNLAAERLERRELAAQRVHAGARGLGLAGQLVEAAAVLPRLGVLDGDGGELLAQGVGLALDRFDALQRGGELGAGGLGLAGALALQALDRGGQLGPGGLRSLLVLGADLLELGDQLAGGDVAGGHAAALGLGQAGLDDRAGLVGTAAGLGDRLVGGALRPGDRGGQAGVGGGGGLRALALQAVEPGGELVAGGLGGVERAAAVVRGLLGVQPRALEALEAGEKLAVLCLVHAGGGRRGEHAVHLGAQRLGLALGGLGAALGAQARLLELAGEAEGDALELVDALHRRQQPRDDGGGVVEIGDRVALDAGIDGGQALLDLGVGLGPCGLAARELGLHPRRGLQGTEDDQRAGRAPALPGLGLGLERLAQRPDDDGVLRAHALQHQVHRELEAEVLEEQREVESLVELDGHEHRVHREVVALGVERGDLDAAWRRRRLSGLQEAAPRLGGARQRGLDEQLEEGLAEDVVGGAAEQQLGGLGPLRDGALPVGQDEVAADDLAEDRVQRVVSRRLGSRGQHLVGGGPDARGGVHDSSIGRTTPDPQPFVEKNRRGARIQRRRSPRLLRQGRGEALVVELHGHVERRLQAVSKLTRLGRLGAVGAAERHRQADDDALGAQLGHELTQPLQALLGRRPQTPVARNWRSFPTSGFTCPTRNTWATASWSAIHTMAAGTSRPSMSSRSGSIRRGRTISAGRAQKSSASRSIRRLPRR